ncbi:MAG TPA: hypothetical protein VGL08_20670 [Paraburkholderia sp.]|jgi:predicted lipid-binding transport protein (Tim44 family)
MQYVFSMTSRMVTIAASCTLLLCVLLFLLGVEIGARFVGPAAPEPLAQQQAGNVWAAPVVPARAAPAAPSAPATAADPDPQASLAGTADASSAPSPSSP